MSTYTDKRIPYWYIIQHTPSGKFYTGSKYGKDADPKTFMVAGGYQTSSKRVGGVHDLIRCDGLLSFKIIMLLTEAECGMHVLEYETNFIRDNNIVEDDNWLNISRNNNTHAYGTEKYYMLMEKKYGYRHNTQNPEVIRKREEKSLLKYGVKNSASRTEVKEKVKQTFLNKTGFNCNFSNPELRKQYEEKYKEIHGVYWNEDKTIQTRRLVTYHEKYSPGSEAALQLLEKYKESCLKNMGVENPSQCENVKVKKETTCMKNHGVKHPGQSKEVQLKAKETNLKKYGVDSWSKTEEGRKFASESMKKMRANMKPVECPHCGLVGSPSNMNRWHFSNCKLLTTKQHE